MILDGERTLRDEELELRDGDDVILDGRPEIRDVELCRAGEEPSLRTMFRLGLSTGAVTLCPLSR